MKQKLTGSSCNPLSILQHPFGELHRWLPTKLFVVKEWLTKSFVHNIDSKYIHILMMHLMFLLAGKQRDENHATFGGNFRGYDEVRSVK